MDGATRILVAVMRSKHFLQQNVKSQRRSWPAESRAPDPPPQPHTWGGDPHPRMGWQLGVADSVIGRINKVAQH